MERNDNYNEIEELLGKDIPVNEEKEEPRGPQVCISCEG